MALKRKAVKMTSEQASKRPGTIESMLARKQQPVTKTTTSSPVQRSDDKSVDRGDASVERSASAGPSSVQRSEASAHGMEAVSSFETAPGFVSLQSSSSSDVFDDSLLDDAEMLQAEASVLPSSFAVSDENGRDLALDDHIVRNVVASASSAAANVANFHDLLLLLVGAIMTMTRRFSEDASLLDAINVAELVGLTIQGMSFSLVAYLDKCVANGIGIDLANAVKLGYPRKKAMGTRGGYFFLLQHRTKPVEFPYTGSGVSWAVEGMEVRLRDHHSDTYRKGNFRKPLYQVWNCSDVLCCVLWILPNAYLGQAHGDIANRLIETAMILLFLGAAEWETSNLPVQDLPLPVKNFIEATKSAQRARGVRVYGKNITVPVYEFGHAPMPLIRLDMDKGVHLNLVQGTGAVLVLYIDHGWRITISRSQEKEMFSMGFSMDRPRVNLRVLCDPVEDPDHHWANVTGTGQTDTNPEGYEMARHIKLELTFVDAADETQSIFIRRTSQKTSALQRAMEAMTLLEFAQGSLPRGDNVFNPRRRDGLQGELKIWDPKHPAAEQDLRPGELWQCKPCGLRWRADQSQMAKAHFSDGIKRASHQKKSKECREQIGLTGTFTLNDVLAACRIPGVLESEAEAQCRKFWCFQCDVGTFDRGVFKKHLLRPGQADQQRLAECRKGCGISDLDDFKNRSDEFLMTAEEYAEFKA